MNSRGYETNYISKGCTICYATATAGALTVKVRIPSVYYSGEFKEGKPGDPICGRCLVLAEHYDKVEEAKKYKAPVGSHLGPYGGGYFRKEKAETVRPRKVFGKQKPNAAEEGSEEGDPS